MKAQSCAILFKRAFCLFSTTALLFCAVAAQGATKTWDGSHSGYWSNPNNWSGNTVPDVGDDLVFPGGASHLVNTNDLGFRAYGNIKMSGNGYILRGSGSGATIALNDGIEFAGNPTSNTIELNLFLLGSQEFGSSWLNANLYIKGDVELNGHTLTLSTGGSVLNMSGVISGSGDVVIEDWNDGTIRFSGSSANTYTGTTDVNVGNLYLAKTSGSAIPKGGLIVGRARGGAFYADAIVREEANYQIGTIPITINHSGYLSTEDNADTVGAITFNGGRAGSAAGGMLILGGDVTANVYTYGANLFGNVSLGTGSGLRTFDIDDSDFSVTAVLSGTRHLVKTGSGSMALHATNTYTGATTVEQGTVLAANNAAFGDTAAGTTVNGTGDIVLFNANIGSEELTLDKSLFFGNSLSSTGISSWAGSVVLQDSVAVGGTGDLELSGVVSGAGSLAKSGAGTLTLSGSSANTFVGDVAVLEGTVLLAKSSGNSVPYSLVVGSNSAGAPVAVARHASGGEISLDVTVNESGIYDLDGYSESIRDLNLNNGADFDSGAATLGLRGNINVDGGVSTIDGALALSSGFHNFNILNNALVLWPGVHCGIDADISGSGSIAKEGPGRLQLSGNNSFGGLVEINEGSILASSATAFGGTGNGTSVSAGTSLLLSIDTPSFSRHFLSEPLSLSGSLYSGGLSNSWSGAVTLVGNAEVNVYSGKTLNLSGPIGGSGELVKSGTGTLIYSGATTNTYSGDTLVNEGVLELDKPIFNFSIAGDLFIGDGIGGADADVVRLLKTSQIPNTTQITIADSGLFAMNNLTEYFGSLAGAGHVDMGNGNLGAGFDGSSTTYSGLIEGSGEFRKFGAGILSLSGNNTYSGDTQVNAGVLLINGSQPGSIVTVNAAGELGGTGTAGKIFSSGAVAPGASAGHLGSGSTTLNAGSLFKVELNGHTPVDYDQLDVGGSVDLGDADLNIDWGFVPALGDSFTIIDNDGGDAVLGTFNGLAEGGSVVAGNVTLQITYAGGTGNDVVLSATDVQPLEDLMITSADVAGGNIGLVWVGGVPFYRIEKKIALTNAVWTAVTAPTRDFTGSVPADTTNGFYRVTGGN